MDHSHIIKKIQKLLSLASSDNEHEAAAAAAKAQALLSEYNLAMSDIPEQETRETKAERAKARTRQRLEDWAFALANHTADAFDCRYFHSADGHTVFVGVGADQEVCAWTFHYLYRTLLRMGSTYLREQCRRLRSNRSRDAARISYLNGVVYTVSKRLQAQKKVTPVTESALVPVKESAIEAEMPDDLRHREPKKRKVRDRDLLNGLRDGRAVPLSKPLNAAQRTVLQEG
ncbi:DUF2786 domain-containing protein [Pseudodesulfovibrio indicus]|uniref:Uncharacterized protein DUF2786 n=1 Tax=Pseudodesulfovibrio indicus TaxID=1716143 RepID=A0A140D8V1_9BACT|nr:DUF2786 domain-containing protein [Pseudodesulfovibrio indicus]AMK09618.1 hypothetical protein AWY79_00095 [Pseudodesulfovibrio indicus]TDT86434.1 uncharacterized protein DUF2786 [Pseudodesulfovibrio indicus]